LLSLEKPQYDAILCLSVTKWIHLNYGDDGIKFMFKRIFKQLNPNGVLILEAQAFPTYKKRSKLCEEIERNFKRIQLKPEKFESFLLSDEVGFTESWCLVNQEILKESGLPKGFHRPLQVFIKR
jgi:7SK snRNA methylphosphate capping enzyme